MQTVTLEIKNDNALKVLKDLQEKHFISILATPDLKSHVFPGEPMTETEFKNFITERESGESIDLKVAKTSWAKKRQKLTNLTK